MSAEYNRDIINIDNDEFIEESKHNEPDYDYDDFEFEDKKINKSVHSNKSK